MSPKKIIIDTDPGVDDVLAILLGLSSPEVSVEAITIVFGNTDAKSAYKNLLKIYHALDNELMQRPESVDRYAAIRDGFRTKLALGEEGPIAGEKSLAAYFHGPDGLSNITETNPEFTPEPMQTDAKHKHLDIDERPAYEVMLEAIAASPDELTIVALGPLTNVARALREKPEVFKKVAEVVWMGGALDHPGNTSASAEFNCFADPYAADEVLSAVRDGSFRLTMAPLDITTPHTIPFDDLIHENAETPLRAFSTAMLRRVRKVQASFGLSDAMEMHDPLAVWYAIATSHGEAQGWQMQSRDFAIERVGELTRGMCVVDRRGSGESEADRTKSAKLAANGIPEQPLTLPPKDDTVDRMGKPVEKGKGRPRVIVQTPGKEELRRVLLGRVFGASV